VYATVFSGFYLAMALVLGALILRGISIEFRSKGDRRLVRRAWDFGFFLGSALAALLFGRRAGQHPERSGARSRPSIGTA